VRASGFRQLYVRLFVKVRDANLGHLDTQILLASRGKHRMRSLHSHLLSPAHLPIEFAYRGTCYCLSE